MAFRRAQGDSTTIADARAFAMLRTLRHLRNASLRRDLNGIDISQAVNSVSLALALLVAEPVAPITALNGEAQRAAQPSLGAQQFSATIAEVRARNTRRSYADHSVSYTRGGPSWRFRTTIEGSACIGVGT
jgi:hypothetical protein